MFNVKMMLAGAVALGILCSVNAADKNDNLLKGKWKIYGKKTTTIDKSGVIACVNKTKKDIGGVVKGVSLNQKTAQPIYFSAESKAENVVGSANSKYSIYLDITHTDGSHTYGVIAKFKTGTHDWQKVERTFTPKKPIKYVNYYLLFRWRTGNAWFRNAMLKISEKK
jgi:hypothetical protein